MSEADRACLPHADGMRPAVSEVVDARDLMGPLGPSIGHARRARAAMSGRGKPDDEKVTLPVSLVHGPFTPVSLIMRSDITALTIGGQLAPARC